MNVFYASEGRRLQVMQKLQLVEREDSQMDKFYILNKEK